MTTKRKRVTRRKKNPAHKRKHGHIDLASATCITAARVSPFWDKWVEHDEGMDFIEWLKKKHSKAYFKLKQVNKALNKDKKSRFI